MPIITQKRLISPISQIDLMRGLVGWWPETDGTANDISGFNYNGTLNGGPKYTGAPVINRQGRNGGLAYTTTQYASMGNINALSFEYTDPHSIFLWFKTTSAKADVNIVSKQLNSGNFPGYGLAGQLSGGVLYGFVYTGANPGLVAGFPSFYNDGIWRHIGYTYNGNGSITGFTLYVNGVSVTRTTLFNIAGSGSIKSSASFQINGRSGANSCLAHSSSDVRVYNRVVTPSEVKALYASSFYSEDMDILITLPSLYKFLPNIPMLGL